MLSVCDPFGQSLTESAVAAPGDQVPEHGRRCAGGFEAQAFGASAGRTGAQAILLWARLYVVALARFAETDAERRGGANSHDIAMHDPVSMTDSSGRTSGWLQALSTWLGVPISMGAASLTARASAAIERIVLATLGTANGCLVLRWGWRGHRCSFCACGAPVGVLSAVAQRAEAPGRAVGQYVRRHMGLGRGTWAQLPRQHGHLLTRCLVAAAADGWIHEGSDPQAPGWSDAGRSTRRTRRPEQVAPLRVARSRCEIGPVPVESD